MIMISFRNFNLSRPLSSQVAPVRLGGEPSRSNAFLHFFEPTQIGRADLFCVAVVTTSFFCCAQAPNPMAFGLLRNQRSHLCHKERAVLCALNHL